MNFFYLLKTSIISLSVNKFRTALTVLGVVIGIASVIVVFSAGAGIEALITGQVESFGTDIISSEVRVPSSKKGSNNDQSSATAIAQGVKITSMVLDDMKEINKLDNVIDSYGAEMSQMKVNYKNESTKTFIYGVSASYINIDQSEIEFGRFFSQEEDNSLTKVIVLGSKIKQKLFGDNEALGEYVKLDKLKYRVVGIMKSRGAVMMMDYDDFIYMPIQTMQKKVLGIEHISYMIHQIKNLDIAEDTAEEIRVILRNNHNIEAKFLENGTYDIAKDDFRVTTMSEMMDMLTVITDAITWLLLAIVAISLLVGGVGIMNIMYVVVSERTSEIGLRKAVGARYRDILNQFLIESIIVTLLGGIFGIILGITFSYLLAIIANYYKLDWDFQIPLISYFVAIIFSFFFGIFFGIYPAKKAAKMDPVFALRNE